LSATLSLESIKTRAAKFSGDFKSATYELGHAQNFIRGLCAVFELSHLRAVSFEHRVKKSNGRHGRIDGFFPGLLLIEMKSAGEDLELAYQQATKYLQNLPTEELPRHIIVSDFANIHLYDRETHAEPIRFKLIDLVANIDCLLFMAGYKDVLIQRQEDINRRAAELIGDLHDSMRCNGYVGNELEMYLVRLLFCLFADDTGLFGENGRFLDLLINHTKVDGTDLHGQLLRLFTVLDTPESKRLKNLQEHMRRFTYVNGELFKGVLPDYSFNEKERGALISLAGENWAEIDPAIFGALFQHIMHHEGEAAKAKTQKRRELGAHYTSEINILKAIKPLFVEPLWQEFESVKNHRGKLGKFHDKLAGINIFDPACGCGNFLVVAYRELRLLELEVIDNLHGNDPNFTDIAHLVRLDVDQFHGIEIDSTAARIAVVAMWLTDHQMNQKLARLGAYMHRLPLIKRPNIICGNAMKVDWKNVLPVKRCSYIIGNPPFRGYSNQTKEQRQELANLFVGYNGAGVLDYVAGWYGKAVDYMNHNPTTRTAFVSTNSICQGEQVGVLWGGPLRSVHIQFAHRTFRWSNEGRGVAAVHCVIVGFGLSPVPSPVIYDYQTDLDGEPIEISAKTINPYLVDAPTVYLEKRRKPMIDGVPEMVKGSQPTDGGHLLFDATEAQRIKATDAIAANYIRPFVGADEFINNLPRYCLWLENSTVADRMNSTEILQRMEAVRKMRLGSPKLPTQKLAEVAYKFGEIRQTGNRYIILPRHSSEIRQFLPIGYAGSDTICGDANFVLPNASFYHFGILCSTMHNTWMRAVCGRIKSDFRYSNTIVYNNFVWPLAPSQSVIEKISNAAQEIIKERETEELRCSAEGQPCSLATLYSPGNMPSGLIAAHRKLDKLVDSAYCYTGGKDDANRVAFLFERYVISSSLGKEDASN
jgi:hypothetical protein